MIILLSVAGVALFFIYRHRKKKILAEKEKLEAK